MSSVDTCIENIFCYLQGIVDIAGETADIGHQVLETIRPACSNERVSDFDEDFVVYYFKENIPDWDLVPLLLKDRTPVSEQTRRETLENRFSYAEDITYLAWDSAVDSFRAALLYWSYWLLQVHHRFYQWHC